MRSAVPRSTDPTPPPLSQAVSPPLPLVKLVSHVLGLQGVEWLAESCGGPRGPAALELSRPFPPGIAFDLMDP